MKLDYVVGTDCNMDLNDDRSTQAISAWERCNLKRGQGYRVTKAFTDADGMQHVAGEEWAFIGSKFSRFEDEYILSICIEPSSIQSLRLSCAVDQQDEVVKHFGEY